MHNDLVKKLDNLEKDLSRIDELINQQNIIIEKLTNENKYQAKVVKALYKELHGKKKKIEDLERSKIEECGNNK